MFGSWGREEEKKKEGDKGRKRENKKKKFPFLTKCHFGKFAVSELLYFTDCKTYE